MTLEQIRQAIIQRRQERGLTQEALGQAASLSREQISRFENGVHDPGLRRLLRLCQALDLELLVRPGAGLPTLDDLDHLFNEES
ncbi:MAG: helix-turn-helix transcriptional regulator [Fluviibacter sp.]